MEWLIFREHWEFILSVVPYCLLIFALNFKVFKSAKDSNYAVSIVNYVIAEEQFSCLGFPVAFIDQA